MKYLGSKFTVPLGGDAFAEGWERIFGKKAVDCARALEGGLWVQVGNCTGPFCEVCGDCLIHYGDRAGPCVGGGAHCKDATHRPQSLETPDLT